MTNFRFIFNRIKSSFTRIKESFGEGRGRSFLKPVNYVGTKVKDVLFPLRRPVLILARFLKIWFSRLVLWEKIIVGVFSLITIICALLLSYNYYLRNTKIIPLSGGEYIEGIVGEPKYINPVLCQANKVDRAISQLVFSGLTKFDAQGKIIPDLAEKFEQSPDGKVFKFYLRKNIFWHDGKPLTSDDVVFTINLLKDPDYQGPLKNNWKEVKIEKINNQVIQFTLNNYSVSFLPNTTVGILPQHILKDIPVKNLSLHTFNLNPVGTGPYAFEKLELNDFGGCEKIILKRNGHYYASKPYLDKVIFSFYSDENDIFEAYKEKDILGIESIKPDGVGKTSYWRNFKLYRTPLPEYMALFFNTKKPPLDNQNLRQALAYATDKEEVIKKALHGEAKRVDSPILPNFFGYDSQITRYYPDQRKVAEILQKLGFQKNKEGFWAKDNKKLELSIVTLDNPLNKKIAEIIQKQWNHVGIRVKIQTLNNNILQQDYIRPRNYQILLFGQNLGNDPDVFPYWHSTEINDPGVNLSCYENKEADRCLEKARQTPDQNIRREEYIKFQKMIAQDIPAIFLYQPNYIFGVSGAVHGIKLGFLLEPAYRFQNIDRWYIKYKRKR